MSSRYVLKDADDATKGTCVSMTPTVIALIKPKVAFADVFFDFFLPAEAFSEATTKLPVEAFQTILKK